jgi:hypothetical protein
MTLAELQRAFRAHIERGEGAINDGVPPAARRGLAVYHHAYRANLVACLADTFEKTAAWLGEGAFEAAALEHVAGHPPASWTLNDYGQGFDDTLEGLYPADPEVAELAWLDWSLRRAFDGPDAEVQDPADLAGVDWDRAVLRLAPTLALRRTRTNAAALWSAMAAGDTPPEVACPSGAAGLAVWRRDLSPRFRSLAETDYRALEQALAGARFAEICEALADDALSGEDTAAFAGGLLSGWLAEQIVIGAHVPAIPSSSRQETLP